MPPQHVIGNEVREAPQRVQHRQRQAREKLEHVTHEVGRPNANAPALKAGAS